MTAVTHAELLDVVYRFHPRGLYVDGLGYSETEERWRQRNAAERARADAPKWKAMLERLRGRFGPLMDQSILLLSGVYDPAWSADIFIPGRSVGFCVCVLGPYYGIKRTGDAGEALAALDLSREIEAAYPGYQPIPPDLGDLVVPDVALGTKNFGSATIYHCLLSEVWGDMSGPWPPPPPPPRPPREPPILVPGQHVITRGDRPAGEPPDAEPLGDDPDGDDE